MKSIKADRIYVNQFSMDFRTEEISKTMTIIILPVIKTYSDGDHIENPYFNLYLADGYFVTYGKNQVRIQYKNQNLTVITEYLAQKVLGNIYIGHGAVVDIDENVYENELIYPNIRYLYEHEYDPNTINTNSPSILGNWPICKNFDDDNLPYLIGSFFYLANNFPVNRNFICTFVLIQKVSSVYCVTDGIPSLKLKTLTHELQVAFIINGVDLRYVGLTGNPNITVVLNAYEQFNYDDNVIYKRIDNTLQRFDNTAKFQKGGTIITSYGINYRKLHTDLKELLQSYENEHPRPDTFSVHYYIDFAKNKISDLSYLVNNLMNEGFPVTISMTDVINNSVNQINTIVTNRIDVLVSKIYQNSFNKEANLVCAESGTLNISEWKYKQGTNLFLGFSETDSQIWYSIYLPKISNVIVNGDFISTENGRCIGFRSNESSIPVSSVEFIVYTTNTTFIEILSKIDLITTLTSSDLDAFSKLHNKKVRNIFIFILDDLPNNKQINLKGVQREANIFLFGFKLTNLDDLFECINLLDKLDGSDDDYDAKFVEYVTRLFKNYERYYVKASVDFNVVYELVLLFIDFCGTKIRCTNFYPLFSTFSNTKQLKNSFKTQLTWTDTFTYNSMSELSFYELLIFPISVDPPNIVGVEQVDFYNGKCVLKMNDGLVKLKGFEIQPSTLTINTNNIEKNLYIYSFNHECIFNIPEEEENIKIKETHHKLLYFTDFKEILKIMILEDQSENENTSKIKKILTNLFNLFISKKSLLSEDKEQTYKFTGNWNKVTEIDGTFGVSAGYMPVVVEQIPPIVMQVFDVESEKSIKITTSDTTSSNKINFKQPQIISSNKVISFNNKEMDVSFNELLFKNSDDDDDDDSIKLSLLLDGNPSKIITNKVVVESKTNALISGDLEVKESFELGPTSSITANSISSDQPSLILNYRLSNAFCKIHDSIIEPKSITLNYIGESENIDDVFDYSDYLGRVNIIKTFDDNDHKNQCEKWKEKTSFNSSLYPEFVGNDNKIIKVICIDEVSQTSLATIVTLIPNGDVNIPTFEPEIPSFDDIDDDKDPDKDDDYDTSGVTNIPNEGKDDNDDQNKKKKLSDSAIIGIATACVIVVAVVSILLWFFISRNKKKDEEHIYRVTVAKKKANKKKEVEKKSNHDNSTDEDFDFWM